MKKVVVSNWSNVKVSHFSIGDEVEVQGKLYRVVYEYGAIGFMEIANA